MLFIHAKKQRAGPLNSKDIQCCTIKRTLIVKGVQAKSKIY
jgi:hypothetical protein